MERVSPSHVGKGGFAPVMRLATAIGLVGGLHILYQRSCSMPVPGYTLMAPRLMFALLITSTDRFYGFTENSREVEMDNREMVDKVKKGEPLYGASKLSAYLQGVAARNSRYSELFIHVIPWVNAVNHDQVSRLHITCASSMMYGIVGLTRGISTELTPPSTINKLRGNLKLRRPALTKIVALQGMKTLEDLTANPASSVVGSCILTPLGATVVYNARSFQKKLEKTQH